MMRREWRYCCRARILSTAPIDRLPIEILEQIAPVEMSPAPDEEILLDRLEDTVAIVVRGVEAKINVRIISSDSALQVIGLPETGSTQPKFRSW